MKGHGSGATGCKDTPRALRGLVFMLRTWPLQANTVKKIPLVLRVESNRSQLGSVIWADVDCSNPKKLKK